MTAAVAFPPRATKSARVAVMFAYLGMRQETLDAEGRLAKRFAARDFPLYLIRPDEHVAARFQAGAVPSAVADALEVALGRRRAAGASGAVAAQPPTQAIDGRVGALGREGLERVFEAVSRGVDAAASGEADRRFLARLALLLAEEVGDPERVLTLVAAASEEQASGAD